MFLLLNKIVIAAIYKNIQSVYNPDDIGLTPGLRTLPSAGAGGGAMVCTACRGVIRKGGWLSLSQGSNC